MCDTTLGQVRSGKRGMKPLLDGVTDGVYGTELGWIRQAPLLIHGSIYSHTVCCV